MTGRFRARIETTVDGQPTSLPVFPRTRTSFATQAIAVRAIEAKARRSRIAGRGVVYPADLDYDRLKADPALWNERVYTIAL